MARFNKVQLDAIYLTDDESGTGLRCKSEVTGLDELFSAYTGATQIAISGKPFNFTRENDGAGVLIVVKPFVVSTDLRDDLKTLVDGALAADITFQTVFTGDNGIFDLNCKPRLNKPIEFSGKFINGRIYDLAINLVVDSINSITP
jgi:hypothetical protein